MLLHSLGASYLGGLSLSLKARSSVCLIISNYVETSPFSDLCTLTIRPNPLLYGDGAPLTNSLLIPSSHSYIRFLTHRRHPNSPPQRSGCLLHPTLTPKTCCQPPAHIVCTRATT
ncbi:uncharacterized protein K441DRAFT_310153 [Cenococcum geophilum 1.58]|uniref:uncharacterized protein n=1 Tax=Cenococcum geophilum 1.58 TaxID=794803 RepID=UPI0035900D8C|nr:hypothetical protein K441DRAFT_310153 [Cenococcum geophilum 1.58]